MRLKPDRTLRGLVAIICRGIRQSVRWDCLGERTYRQMTEFARERRYLKGETMVVRKDLNTESGMHITIFIYMRASNDGMKRTAADN
jgi:hypothetical protein